MQKIILMIILLTESDSEKLIAYSEQREWKNVKNIMFHVHNQAQA